MQIQHELSSTSIHRTRSAQRGAGLKRMAAAVGLIGLAACGTGTGEKSADPAAPNTFSPLDQYLNTGLGQDADPAKDREVQDKIAACMQAAGFEYVPVAPEDPQAEDESTRGDRAWTEKFGYGITTSALTVDLAPKNDPNNKITDAMSDTEKNAYWKVLYGSGGGVTATAVGVGSVSVQGVGPAVAAAIPGMGAEIPDGKKSAASDDPPSATPEQTSTGADAVPTGSAEPSGPAVPGCFTTARTEVYGEMPQVDFSQMDDIFTELGKASATIDSDPRVAPLVTAWSNCMADAGHTGLSKIDDARESIMKAWADLNGWDYQPSGNQGFSFAAGGAVAALAVDDGTKGPDQAKVDALKADEIALAVKDLDCRGDYQAAHDKVRIEVEQKFADEHADELNAYRNSVNGG